MQATGPKGFSMLEENTARPQWVLVQTIRYNNAQFTMKVDDELLSVFVRKLKSADKHLKLSRCKNGTIQKFRKRTRQ